MKRESWLRENRSKKHGQQPKQPSRRRRSYQPYLELLEDRRLLALGTPTWVPEGPGPSQSNPYYMPGIPGAPGTGDVAAVAVNPNNPNQVFAATADGGIWMTNNAYAALPDSPTWQVLTDNMPFLAMGAIAFSPLDNQNQPVTSSTLSQNLVIYAGTGLFSNGSLIGTPVGLYKSTNGGGSWSLIPGPFAASGLSINRFLATTMMDSGTGPGRGGQIVFASVAELNLQPAPKTARGLYRSLDSGNTWTLLSGGTNPSGSSLTGGSSTGLPADIGVSDVSADPVNNLYAALVSMGVYVSTDGGSTWKATTGAIPNVATDGNSKINLSVSKQIAPLTTSNTAVTTTGAPTLITPASMQGISTGVTLVVDTGASQESVTVSSVTTTTFTATFAKTHAAGFTIAAYPVYVGLVNNSTPGSFEPGTTVSQLQAAYVSLNLGATWIALANVPDINTLDQGLNDFEILADPNNWNIVYVGGDSSEVDNYGNHYQAVFTPSPSNFTTGTTTWNPLDALGAIAGIVGGGTSSGGNSATTLNDTTQAWATNQWRNGLVQITGGTGAGQVRTIASNTATALTVSANWITVPDNTSTYAITFSSTSTASNTATTLNDTKQAWITNQWKNNTVLITGGTGLGQAAIITANTATTLTVSTSWAIVPDNTSTYVIGFASTSTGSDTNATLNDTTQNWANNQWAGDTITITGGTGNGQTNTVTANTATTLTVASSWATVPDSTSTYVISFSNQSSGGNTNTPAPTLNDTTQSWANNQWAGGTIQITGGRGHGQTNTIVSNTATTLIVSSIWTTVPDSSSTYVISVAGTSTGGNTNAVVNDTTQAWATNQWAGDAIQITGGTGAGQVNTISSNTTTTLTLGNSWATVPDATSTYRIGLGTSPHSDSHNFMFDASGNIIEGNDGGIYRLNNPANPLTRFWSALNGNSAPAIQAFELYSVSFDSVNQITFSGAQDNGSPQQNAKDKPQSTNDSGGDGQLTQVFNQQQPGSAFQSIRYASYENLGGFTAFVYGSGNSLVSSDSLGLNIQGTATNGTLSQIDSPFSFTIYAVNAVDPSRLLIGTRYLYESAFGTPPAGISGQYQNGNTLVSLGGLSGNKPQTSVGSVYAIAYGGMLNGTPNPNVAYVGTSGNNALLMRTTPPATFSGTYTAVTANSLTDSSQTWTTNQWAGAAVQITAGTGAGEVATISSNNANTLTLSANWATMPDATSTYAIIPGVPGTSSSPPNGFSPVTTYSGATPQAIVLDPANYNTVYILDTNGDVWYSPNATTNSTGGPGVAFAKITGNLASLASNFNYNGLALYKTSAGTVLFAGGKPLTVTGTSSGTNTATTLNDTTQAWTTNQWQNGTVWITGGTGAGQSATVTSNTATTLTVSSSWTTVPDNTSTYFLAPAPGVGGVYVNTSPTQTTGTITWNNFGQSLPAAQVTSLTVDPTNNVLVASTYGRGAWEVKNLSFYLGFPPPVLSLNGAAGQDFTATFTQGGGPVAVVGTTTLTVTDADQPNLQSATIRITNVKDGVAEVLAADTSGTTITAAYDRVGGLLTLTGNDTLAHYQQVLRTITYNNTAVHLNATTRKIDFRVNDGFNNSAVVSTTLTIAPKPTSPRVQVGAQPVRFVASGGPTPIGRGTTVTFAGTITAGQVTITNLQDGAAESLGVDTGGTGISALYSPASGVLTLTGNDSAANYQKVLSSLTYQDSRVVPNTTTRVITVAVDAGAEHSPAAEIDVQITLVNHAPVVLPTATFQLSPVPANTPNNPGTSVFDLLDGVQPPNAITDVDPGTALGIAVVGTNNSQGTWQFSSNGGASWQGFDNPSVAHATLLTSRPNTRVRFVPAAGFAGVVAGGLSFRVWDITNPPKEDKLDGRIEDTTKNGGSTPYSSAIVAAGVTVTPAGTSVVIASAPNPSVFGQIVTFTATVSALSPAAGTPTGTVTFSDGGSPIGTSTLNNGTATLQRSTLTVGTHSITATYSGDNSFAASTSPALSQVVNAAQGPTVTIGLATGQASTTTTSPIQFSIVFSAPVTGFTGSSVTIAGTAGATTAAVSGSGATYTLSISGMTQTGTVIVSVPAGVVQDSSGNPNQASTGAPTVTFQVNSILAPTTVVAVAVPAGIAPTVTVLDSTTAAVAFTITPYDPAFTGGVHVATGGGIIVTAPGAGGGPDVKVFSSNTGQFLFSTFAFDPRFTGGVAVAVGDVNGDGFADIIAGAGTGGGPNVVVISGKNGAVLYNFFAFNPAFTGGVSVAAGDVNADGFADIVVGAGTGGGPNVIVVSGQDGQTVLDNFFAFDPAFTGGVAVAAEDLNRDRHADIIAGAGPGGGPSVAAFDGGTLAVLNAFFAYNPQFIGGVQVAQGGVTNTGQAVIRTGKGPTPTTSFDALLLAQLDSFFAFDVLTETFNPIAGP